MDNRNSIRTWTVNQARTKLDELIDRSTLEGPQFIAKKGQPVAVVVSADEWKRTIRPRGSLADFFASSPLRGSGIKISRLRGKVRKVQL